MSAPTPRTPRWTSSKYVDERKIIAHSYAESVLAGDEPLFFEDELAGD